MSDPRPAPFPAQRVPPGLRLATAYAWRLLLLAGAGYVVLLILVRLQVVVLPLIAAVLVTALLDPIARRLRATRMPNWAAATVLVLGTIAALGALGLLIVPELIGQLSAVDFNVRRGIQQVESFLVDRLPVSQRELEAGVSRAFGSLQSRIGSLAGRVIGAATFAVQVVLQAFAAVFLLFFFLKDGSRFYGWLRDVVPERRRGVVEELLPQIWETSRAYLLGVMIIGVLDALGIGLALVLIGVPLVVPLMILTFFGAFFPLVGAIAVGALAALVALVSGGIGDALLVVGAALFVQQVEGNVLQPLVMGHQVEVHPAVTLLAVAAGGTLAGIAGAFLAVPVVAVARRVIRYLAPRVAAAGGEGRAARLGQAVEGREGVPP